MKEETMDIIFEDTWIKIGIVDGKHCIRYNSGDLTNSIKEVFVSEEDAGIAQRSSQDAMNVINKYYNLEMGLK